MGVHELATPIQTARYRSLQWVGKRKLTENELTDCYIAVGTAGFARRLTEMLGVVWRRMVSNGVEWEAPMASMASVALMASMSNFGSDDVNGYDGRT